MQDFNMCNILWNILRILYLAYCPIFRGKGVQQHVSTLLLHSLSTKYRTTDLHMDDLIKIQLEIQCLP